MTSAPFHAKPATVSAIMLKVLAALLPLIAVQTYFFGVGLLIQLALASVSALAAEAAMLRLRGLPVLPFLKDGSALLTGWLLALTLPSLGAWWMVALATIIAIVVAKQLYGGLGQNPFNPAMVGFAVMIVAFPAHIAQWGSALQPLDATAQLQWIFSRQLPPGAALDAVSSATPLDYLKTQLLIGGQPVADILRAPLYASQAAIAAALAASAGGLYLWRQRIIAWHAPLAMLAGVCAVAAPLWLLEPARYASPLFHLLNGATLLGAFFIVTDPVTSPTTARGRLLFGFLAGVLLYVIRVFGGFPDAVAFAVLIMNIAVPFIDLHTQPRVFGKRERR
nr:RnfABCDGE type electron transport complex subunit D [Chromobacterium sp. ASV5]